MTKIPDPTEQMIFRALSALIAGVDLEGPTVLRGAAAFKDEEPLWTPDDLTSTLAVTALATVANGGQEIKFNRDGLVVPGPGAAGAYWSRSTKQRWIPIVAGRPIPYTAEHGFFIAQSSTGITPGGTLTLEFYAKPEGVSWARFRSKVGAWSGGGFGGATGTGTIIPPKGSPIKFTTNGRAAPAIAGTAIVSAVTVPTAVVVITDQTNASPIFFADTQAKAALLGAAGGGQPLYAAGADVFPLDVGESLWAASADGLQLCYIRREVAS